MKSVDYPKTFLSSPEEGRWYKPAALFALEETHRRRWGLSSYSDSIRKRPLQVGDCKGLWVRGLEVEIELGAEEVAFGIFGYAGDASRVVVFLIGVEGLPYHILPGDVFNTEDISFGIRWQGAPFVIVGDIAIAAKVDIAVKLSILVDTFFTRKLFYATA